MKHLLTAIACCLTVAGSAQTWNPDADFDNVIGVNDLMALLSVFGTEWTAEYPQDSAYELAAYYDGVADFAGCKRNCVSNGARVLSGNEYIFFEDSVLATVAQDEYFWIHSNFNTAYFSYARKLVSGSLQWARFYNVGLSNNSAVDLTPEDLRHCFCTGLIPAVE